MTNDELVKRTDNLSGWLRRRGYQDYKVVDELHARIRELEAQLASVTSGLNAACRDLNGVDNETHVIVPVEPTIDALMPLLKWRNSGGKDDQLSQVYSEIIKAAQEQLK